MTQNRKRLRNFQDETEFMPLSKRINNLHINNLLSEANNLHLPDPALCHRADDSFPNVSAGSFGPQYTPDLSELQNPHYYNINKLLYEMYVERVNRGCHRI